VAVGKKNSQIFSQLALETAEKNHAEVGRVLSGFDLKFL
jgi:hypothetical protein